MTECIFFDAARSCVYVTEAERKRQSDSQRACINRGCLSLVCLQAQVFIGYMKAGTLESCVWLNVIKHSRVVFLCKIKKITIFHKENEHILIYSAQKKVGLFSLFIVNCNKKMFVYIHQWNLMSLNPNTAFL